MSEENMLERIKKEVMQSIDIDPSFNARFELIADIQGADHYKLHVYKKLQDKLL
jgi:hypothetical protein